MIKQITIIITWLLAITVAMPASPVQSPIAGRADDIRPVARVTVAAQQPAKKTDSAAEALAIERTRTLVDEIIAASYPELRGADIQIKLFHDDADYFRTRFGISRFLFVRRMRYFLLVNPQVFAWQAPLAAVRAILAHELGHILYFKQRNRVRLVGLMCLASKRYSARFERRTDLQAISHGYGEGLKEYRAWLYRHVPSRKLAEKKRNYFSPEEIDAIQAAARRQPELLRYWSRHVPRNLKEILETSK
jgi:hypothetical protein